MIKPQLTFFVIVMSIFAVGGCVKKTTPLVKPGIDEAGQAKDKAYCRGWAIKEAERTPVYQSSNALSSDSSSLSAWQSSIQNYDNRQSVISLMRRCLKRRGYQPVSAAQ